MKDENHKYFDQFLAESAIDEGGYSPELKKQIRQVYECCLAFANRHGGQIRASLLQNALAVIITVTLPMLLVLQRDVEDLAKIAPLVDVMNLFAQDQHLMIKIAVNLVDDEGPSLGMCLEECFPPLDSSGLA